MEIGVRPLVGSDPYLMAAAMALAAAELRGEGPTSAPDECDDGEGIIVGVMWVLNEGLLLTTLTVRLVSSASCDTQKQTKKNTQHMSTMRGGQG